MPLYEVKLEEEEWGESLDISSFNPGDAAEDAAEKYFYERDGWAWMNRSVTTFEVREAWEDDVTKVAIEVEHVPHFHGSVVDD